MDWMARNIEKRVDPQELVPGAKSVISVIENYYCQHAPPESRDHGKISRYAWGDDYHDVMRTRLNELLSWLDRTLGGVSGRGFVDSAPIMDKAWAARAGLGWLGKHTNLIHKRIGSWFFIGELIVDAEIEPDMPVPDLCGSCTRCIDACPTGAITGPYVVDARRCISYLTIEHREDDVPEELAALTENWIFGCDVCQDVCPWNKFARESDRASYMPRPGTRETLLSDWAELSEEAFSERFRASPVKRAKHAGFQRNVRRAGANAGIRTEQTHLDPGPRGRQAN
jgi:epoxyqueuosine reductase